MRRMVKDAHAGDAARKAADTALAAQREDALHEAVKRFRSAAATSSTGRADHAEHPRRAPAPSARPA